MLQMSSSSELSDSSDDSGSPTSKPRQGLPCGGPPRQLCACSQCMGQVSQKSYVCAQHIERYGRYRRGTPGASSSHMVSCSNNYPLLSNLYGIVVSYHSLDL